VLFASGTKMSEIAVKSATTAASKETWSDWLSVIIGVLVFALALFSLSGTDLMGWAVTTSVYIALAPVAKTYAGLDGVTALRLTHASLLVVLSAGVAALGADVRKFALSFTVVFAIAYPSWIAGSYDAYIAAATPARHASRRTLPVQRPYPRHRGVPYLAELRRQILGLLGLDTTW
jgi:hypothetical protein